MKKLNSILLVVGLLLLTVAALSAAKGAVHIVDDDGLDCPEAAFSTIAGAVAAATDGDTIRVCSGAYDGVALDKSVEIKGSGQAVIVGGPLHPAGLSQGFRLLAGSDGTTISNLSFDGVDLAIMNGGAVNGVTIAHNYFYSPIQAVSNWMGDDWDIHHNDIENLRTRNGGGIGVFIGDYYGGVVQGSSVSHNNIFGVLTQADGEKGGYNASGIVLYADFRWNREGSDEISNNTILHNKVRVEDQASLVDMVAFELTEARDKPAEWVPLIHNNIIKFNDFLGTPEEFSFSPAELNEHNVYAKNKGVISGISRGANNTPFMP